MTTIHSELDPLELRAREMFAAYLNDDENWSPNAATVAIVFRAMWMASLSQVRIEQIGSALCGYPVFLGTALEELTKAKVLRSHTVHGVKHWEVRFPS